MLEGMNFSNSNITASQTNHDSYDSYALDDTLAGRLAQAAAVGVATAIPDYVAKGPKRVAAYLGLGTAMLGAIAVANAQREEEPQAPHEADAATTTATTATTDSTSAAAGAATHPVFADASDAPAWLLPVVLAGMAAAVTLNAKISAAIVKSLRRRGIGKPWTVLGVTGAALTFAVSEAEARDIARMA